MVYGSMVNNHTAEGKSPCCSHKSLDSHDTPNDIILGFATGDTNFLFFQDGLCLGQGPLTLTPLAGHASKQLSGDVLGLLPGTDDWVQTSLPVLGRQ